jgi:uncharacterized membrane protein
MSSNATLIEERQQNTGRRAQPRTARRKNVGQIERAASALIGSFLVVRGIHKRSPLSLAAAIVGGDLVYRGVTGRCSMYSALGVDTAAADKAGSQISPNAPEVTRSITIGKSPGELYEFWRTPANLSRIVGAVAEVSPAANGGTHWRVRGPFKRTMEWDSRYTEEQPGSRLAWESLPGGSFPNHGKISFRPGPNGSGTEVTLRMQFEPPLGIVGVALTNRMHTVVRGIAGKALRRFKSLVETGEVPTLAHNPSGRGSSDWI